MRITQGAVLAAAAASLLQAACKKADQAAKPSTLPSTVHCAGINECKGKSLCHSPNNACGGQNACKGKGWLDVTEAECTAQGGRPIEVKGM